jgi:hypothetical protein
VGNLIYHRKKQINQKIFVVPRVFYAQVFARIGHLRADRLTAMVGGRQQASKISGFLYLRIE